MAAYSDAELHTHLQAAIDRIHMLENPAVEVTLKAPPPA
jgi:hypothetical protein